ncbi:T9SS type A sorting domain-containing protein [Pontibacter sp. H259]|uniref:T9SS type A sorting domain-containing protein n=1 Tax=Pontibacter sp. H259 TaxID=3133421 RepID=UPI0030C071A9
MKQLYFTLLTLFVLVSSASAQVLLHHENFTTTGTGTVANVFMEPAASWGFTTTGANTLPLSSKGSYARSAATAAGAKSLFVIISTFGYSKATITWDQFRNPYKNNFPLNASVELQYSINGGVTRTTFFTSTNNTNSIWNKVNGGTPIALPAAAMGMPEVRIYWKINFTNANTSSENAYYAIDDITITATPETGISSFDWATRAIDENPFVVSGINAASPYTVDGVTMRWSAALGTGVTHEIAKVDDKNFKAGTKSLTLVQLNATATNGSTIQLDLNKAVEDLTFTIFDLDITADQFADKLSIMGYNNGTQVPLTKNKVRTTSYNQFASSAVSGLANNDNTSAEGDVTFSFPKAVTRIVIQYHNTATVRNANGRQGIAIHNLTWRKEQQVTVLPVELVTFNANRHHATTILDWSTASETDNDRFEIERSHDGRNFSKIGEVAGHGNSNRKSFYTFTDNRPATGINYYRLRQVDFDGTATYSKPVAIKFEAAKAGAAIAQVYPTIAASQVTVGLTTAAGTTDITILDAAGRIVAQYAQVSEREHIIPVQNLQTGVYFVTVNNGQVRETYRFLKK